jgi:hypothetical protein
MLRETANIVNDNSPVITSHVSHENNNVLTESHNGYIILQPLSLVFL